MLCPVFMLHALPGCLGLKIVIIHYKRILSTYLHLSPLPTIVCGIPVTHKCGLPVAHRRKGAALSDVSLSRRIILPDNMWDTGGPQTVALE